MSRLVLAAAIAAALALWLLRVPRAALPEAGTLVWHAAPTREHAVRQVFATGMGTVAALELPVAVTEPVRLSWTLAASRSSDPFRREAPLAVGWSDLAPGAGTARLPIRPPQLAPGREFALRAWFDGPGAPTARLGASSIDAYAGRFEVDGRGRFGDLRVAVIGANLYSDLRLRLAGAPAWVRAPLAHLVIAAAWIAALTVFVADVMSAPRD